MVRIKSTRWGLIETNVRRYNVVRVITLCKYYIEIRLLQIYGTYKFCL